MSSANWISTAIAIAALATAAGTTYLTWGWRVSEQRVADVTTYLHWNREMARVRVANGDTKFVGYNLVIWNRGPREATAVNFSAKVIDGASLRLVDLHAGEFPLAYLAAGARYPIPWLTEPKVDDRAFECRLSWTDGRGHQEQTFPLRRGAVS